MTHNFVSSNFWSSKQPDPESLEMLDPDPDSMNPDPQHLKEGNKNSFQRCRYNPKSANRSERKTRRNV
jgi:hypothetical protein